MTEKKRESQLENLVRYGSAALASRKAKSDPGISLLAMKGFYDSQLDKGDPIIYEALTKAEIGVQSGTGIGDSGIVKAIGFYGTGKYGEAFAKATVEEIIKTVVDSGYKIPEDTLKGLKNYEKVTCEELKKLAEKDKEAEKALKAVYTLDTQKLEVQYYYNLFTGQTNDVLSSLYAKQEQETQE